MPTLARKNLMVDAAQLRRLALRLQMNESETVRYAIDRLLHEDEVVTAAAGIRRRGEPLASGGAAGSRTCLGEPVTAGLVKPPSSRPAPSPARSWTGKRRSFAHAPA
jgi:hypothetical protein